MDYSKIVNIAFVIYAKETANDVLLLPLVSKQQGKNYNYIVVASGLHSGIYKYPAYLRETFKTWTNKGKECYVIHLRDTKKIKNLHDLDESKPLGRYIIKRLQKMYEKA